VQHKGADCLRGCQAPPLLPCGSLALGCLPQIRLLAGIDPKQLEALLPALGGLEASSLTQLVSRAAGE
jgi:hypothetical protein